MVMNAWAISMTPAVLARTSTSQGLLSRSVLPSYRANYLCRFKSTKATKSTRSIQGTKGSTRTSSSSNIALPKASNAIDKAESKPNASTSTDAVANTDQIQVVPFDTPPRLALPTALGFGSARAMYERCPSSILQGLYQGIRLALGMSHKLVRPRLLNWRAIYLPVWKLDSSQRFKARFMGLDYTASITMVETYYPGTSVEPLVSFPGAVPEGSEFLDSMKPFESATVLKAFPRDDMPFDQQNESVQPVLVPFSLLPGKNEDVFRQITNAYRDEEVRFPGQVDAILEAGYPLLLPYYLVEFADDNPAYTGTKMTCMMWGGKKLSATFSRSSLWVDGTWLDPPNPAHMTIIEISPVVPPVQENKPQYHNNAADGARAAIEAGSVEGASLSGLLKHKEATKRGAPALQNVVEQVYDTVKMNMQTLSLDNTMANFIQRIKGMTWIMSYREADANRKYMAACSAKHDAETELATAKAMPDSFGHKRVVTVRKGRFFGYKLRLMSAQDMVKTKQEGISKSQEKLRMAMDTMRRTLPTWMR